MMLRQHKFLVIALVLSLAAAALAAAPGALAEEVKGRIKSVDKDAAKVVVTADGKDLEFKVKEDANITLDGEKAELSDLKADQQVTVTFKMEDDDRIAEAVVAEKAAP